ncbi:erkA, partial [Symbiodinium necroappetens]
MDVFSYLAVRSFEMAQQQAFEVELYEASEMTSYSKWSWPAAGWSSVQAAQQGFRQKREEIETATFQHDSKYEARPAEWFSGVDNKFDGTFQVVGQLDAKYGCTPYKLEAGSIALVARGICTFEQKAQMAKEAGAKAIIVYDEKMSKAPLEQQNRTGRVASKGIQSYQAGDALSGASSAALEKGMTLMMGDQGKPDLDGCMITRANGTALVDSINNGFQPKVLDVKRSRFEDGIDRFIKKDLPKLSTAMDGYSLIQRVSKTDPNEPIVNQLKADLKDFEKAVRSKDYGEIRKTPAVGDKCRCLGSREAVTHGAHRKQLDHDDHGLTRPLVALFPALERRSSGRLLQFYRFELQAEVILDFQAPECRHWMGAF